MSTVKLASPEHEGRLLASIFRPRYLSKILQNIDQTTLGHGPSVEIYKRILSYISSGTEIPTRKEFAEDPTLSDAARLFITKARPYKKAVRVDGCIKRLEEYRKLRILHSSLLDLSEGIKNRKSPDSLLHQLEGTLVETRKKETSTSLFEVGYGANSREVDRYIEDILSGKKPNMIRSGFDGFDRVTGGWALTDLVLIGARRSDGKTSLAIQIAINSYLMFCRNTCIVEIEMGGPQCEDRKHSNLTGIDGNRIRQRDLTKGERKIIAAAHRQFVKHGIKNKCRFSVFAMSNPTCEQIEATVGHLGFELIVIDYMGLIQQDGSRALHESMSQTAAYFKGMAKRKGRECVIILLAQFTDELRAKFARAIEDHVDCMLGWRLGPQERELGIVKIAQLKNRHSPERPFLLEFDLATTSWKDYTGEDPWEGQSEEYDHTTGGYKRGKKRSNQNSKGNGKSKSKTSDDFDYDLDSMDSL